MLIFLEKPIYFSFSGANCIAYTTLFPDLYRVKDGAGFRVYSTEGFSLGNFRVASSNLCFEPVKSPNASVSKVEVSPFGGFFMKKVFALQIPDLPQIKTDIFDRPVPATQKLKVELNVPDKVFSYSLGVDGKQIACEPADSFVVCDMGALGLAQGVSYNLSLQRRFNEDSVVLLEKEIKTLEAARITDSSIKQGEIVYAKPKSIEAVFDKKLQSGKAKLLKVENGVKTELPGTVAITENKLAFAYDTDLARQLVYELEVFDIIAEDGSGLEAPYIIPFTTSGGPKVTHISVGRSGVALGSTATLTFDQPLSQDQDFGKVIALSGGAVIAGKKENQVLIALKNVPMCGDFGITVNDELQSAHNITGGSKWSFAGRMTCHSVATIGFSQKGRAINAYTFGQGGRAIVFTGAIHGNEVSTKLLMERWVAELEANARSIPTDKKIVVIPQLNPDGISAGLRTNARNVDLNRNFAASNWQRDVTDVYNRPFPGGGGASPASESETRAIAGFISRVRPVLVLSYHSVGGVVAANLAGNSAALAGVYAQASGYRNATGTTGDTFEYAVSGTAEDWYAELGVGSILVELGSHSYHQFERNQKAMWAMVNF